VVFTAIAAQEHLRTQTVRQAVGTVTRQRELSRVSQERSYAKREQDVVRTQT